MEAASQLGYCGIEPLRRTLAFKNIDRRSFQSKIRVRRRTNVIVAVATEPKPAETGSSRSRPPKSVNGVSKKIGDVSQEIKRVRAQMEENEDVAILMRGLRGQNLTDSQFAADDVQLRLVEVDESSESLPSVYDPVSISSYWGRRPRAVATRIIQLLSVAGGFVSRLTWDVINKKVKEVNLLAMLSEFELLVFSFNHLMYSGKLQNLGFSICWNTILSWYNEVARAIELREIVTSLGPAYIKLGQALSIRPDILSPVAMAELQKLCDKVPSFPDDVAMSLIEEELGQPWQNIYSELTSSPIAAASLGQVYKGRLKENGDLVAVKVQRPFVLETVTIDLYIIRNLGLVLRRFPQVMSNRSVQCSTHLDEWAARFFEELDYVNEGENGTFFAEVMRKDLPQFGYKFLVSFTNVKKLDSLGPEMLAAVQVVIPSTYSKYTSRKVLTTEWIEGEKLSQSTESDVGDLVSVGVICYLKQVIYSVN
ncbi:hypothetical protein HHK36_022391 [Tetracentron sinense]|uniref:ABC1 atypical kinase-like domain-containing protein n=1 Tax=Tetracentron sinense TaxID=13715 RepID=A0A834YRU6_TETSI|nr:hypothetical protein HHK36_022391 [Tetracentron sinense]